MSTATPDTPGGSGGGAGSPSATASSAMPRSRRYISGPSSARGSSAIAGWTLRRAFRDDRDPAGGLEHRPGNLVERGHLRLLRLLGQLIGSDARPAQVLLDQAAILHEDDRLAFD